MKEKWFLSTGFIFLILFLGSCAEEKAETTVNLTRISFIPQPVSIAATGENNEIPKSPVIWYQKGAEGLESSAELLAGKWNKLTGSMPTVRAIDDLPKEGIYLFLTEEDPGLGREGYKLTIGKKLVSIEAIEPAGCFYGIQTLFQILPAEATNEEAFILPTGVVRDFPEYEYRGAMLDVARHFFEVDAVKRFIDFLATYKMNRLHLHLSDDQGWRIEIKSWPKLTEVGGSTEVGGGKGGFFTQEEFREIVDYARERQITIVPEIDMPGHTNAALASYAELNCDGKATELYTGIEVGFSTLCTDKEITYEFIDDVIRELAEISPGPYFHIGGDESHATEPDDYIYFINRVQKIAVSHGKKVIGWDEIANATLVDSAIVQFWADVENTQKGVEQGAKVIMSPAKKAYLDMKYDSTTELGLSWAGYIEVDSAYMWDPATLVEGVTPENILGIEAPLWTETVTTMDELEYMVFPRLPGYAEIGWSPPEMRNWFNYKKRLADHGKRFESMGINYYPSERVPWNEETYPEK